MSCLRLDYGGLGIETSMQLTTVKLQLFCSVPMPRSIRLGAAMNFATAHHQLKHPVQILSSIVLVAEAFPRSPISIKHRHALGASTPSLTICLESSSLNRDSQQALWCHGRRPQVPPCPEKPLLRRVHL
jgi:hypothetical protein